jgi:hypothetical protein
MTVESSKRTRSRLHALQELTIEAKKRVPTGANLLHQRASDHDSFINDLTGEQVSGGGELTPVEAAAHFLLGDLIPPPDGTRMHPGPIMQLERITHLIGVATAAVHELITIADNALPAEKMDSRSQCVAGIGYEWWAAPKANPNKTRCDNPQEDGRNTGFCSGCRQRMQRAGRGNP